MDISMPGMNGLVATRKLKQLQPGAAIVTLTRHADDAYLQADMTRVAAKVSGYVRSMPVEDYERVKAGQVLVQLVDDDVLQAHEEGGPSLVRREYPHVQHLRIREHHVGRPPE